MTANQKTALDVFDLYRAAYGSSTQGCCLLIADQIQRAIGGEVVAGELTWYGRSCRRSHWWVVKDGEVIDPMGDDFLSTEEATERIEAHRDRNIFDALLARYEKYRVGLTA